MYPVSQLEKQIGGFSVLCNLKCCMFWFHQPDKLKAKFKLKQWYQDHWIWLGVVLILYGHFLKQSFSKQKKIVRNILDLAIHAYIISLICSHGSVVPHNNVVNGHKGTKGNFLNSSLAKKKKKKKKCKMTFKKWPYTGWPKKTGTVDTVEFQDFALIKFFFFTLLDRASFPHYNNTKIIKFGWELFILWVISYGLSFSGFARFPCRIPRHD